MQKLWNFTSKITSNKKQQRKQSALLPSHIGCKIIELEMEIQNSHDPKKQLIIQLLHEYTKAVQFYEEKGDEKYKLYNKKMQSFLKKPDINSILKGGKGDMIMKKQKAQEQIRRQASKSKDVAKKIMETSINDAEKQREKIKKELNNQEQKLEERQQRRNNSIKKQVSALNSHFNLPPKSSGIPKIIQRQTSFLDQGQEENSFFERIHDFKSGQVERNGNKSRARVFL